MTVMIDHSLPDVQNFRDRRGIALDQVGVTGLYYPLTVREKAGGVQPITARVDLFVGLHRDQRGAHLSSMVEALGEFSDKVFSMDALLTLVKDLRARQDARGLMFESADVRIRFKYFVSKAAPMSGISAPVAYNCGLDVSLNGAGSKSVMVGVPVITVCPCSLQISDRGAHNQRAEVTLQVWQDLEDECFIWIEDLIKVVEACGSAEVHTVLKRSDEKSVTEQMFGSPRFVEDIVREVVVRLQGGFNSVRYSVRCESYESIHAHNAFAEVRGVC